MKLNYFRKFNSCLSFHEKAFCNPVYSFAHKSSPLDPIMWTNFTLPIQPQNIVLILYYNQWLGLQRSVFFSGYMNSNYSYNYMSHAICASDPSHTTSFLSIYDIWRRVRIKKLLILQLSLAFSHFQHFKSNILLRSLFRTFILRRRVRLNIISIKIY